MKHKLINADCLKVLDKSAATWDTIFADPPDNIGLGYNGYKDNLAEGDYVKLLREWLECFIYRAQTVWFSYNAKWTFEVGRIIAALVETRTEPLEAKACVQTFTFGQCRQEDLGNNHRPLIRLRWPTAPLLPDAIRVPSWRQLNGDKRADERGRVPGDVFDFPRVTGNSKQRRPYHPTQLNEGLVERCLALTTPKGGTVLDPFGGTGTTLRVCKRLDMNCTLIELDKFYCQKIGQEHSLKITPTVGTR